MASVLRRTTTEVHFNAPGATRTSLLVTTLTDDPKVIKSEAIHKAKVCYGLNISNVTFHGMGL